MAIKIALLVCDDYGPEIGAKFGGYSETFKRFFPSKVHITPFDVRKGIFPSLDIHFDGFLISGSKSSANDDIEWINNLKQFIKILIQRKANLVGICFGHQVICSTLGAPVRRCELEAGHTVLNCTHAGTEYFKREKIILNSSHGETVESCPDGFDVLATSKTGIQIIKSDSVLGIQAHPEFDEDLMQCIIDCRYDPAKHVVRNNTDSDILKKEIIKHFRQ